MRKGISPIVAVVLLIAIAVIAAVGLYFWVGGLATQQPTPSTPGTITASCAGGAVIVCNTGTSSFDADTLAHTDTAGAITKDTTAYANLCNATLSAGDCCVYADDGDGGDMGFIYAATIAQARYSC